MIKQIIYGALAGIHRKQGLNQIRRLEQKLYSVQARFAVPYAYKGKGHFKKIEPRQNPLEIEELYKTICILAPSKVLEIGTARGGTLYLWTQASSTDAVIVSIDLPGGDFGGAYPLCRGPFYKSFAKTKQKIHLLRKDSHDSQTIEEVNDLFEKQPVDFIFIDGDHTYEGVKSDFLNYGRLVRPCGMIAFHDILYRSEVPDIQVFKFWQEIKDKYNSKEIIGLEGSGRKIGIGIIIVE
ncbi:MAG: class I SAM-dependent methyltransferase [Desulfobacterium sp.]|nr:class I SAM-dependent methyltransferase [Desulfobacterium sp.]MBU3947664.1 class I SAM-dependent methyltransferase [Pseudomonadota bacterium]MBU4011025.1 class I SAM-dependent methyltransferase [Pseudomonadota bacterium]MBU4037572.1 class I SAM-dependent methyltransferase [Pseudomonadota bacterium]